MWNKIFAEPSEVIHVVHERDLGMVFVVVTPDKMKKLEEAGIAEECDEVRVGWEEQSNFYTLVGIEEKGDVKSYFSHAGWEVLCTYKKSEVISL